MARALYREWFVHFRFPGHESLPRVPSPLGEIPQGWEVKRQIQNLRRTRDLLLPRLLSGQIDVEATPQGGAS
jgi:hypothetical protein